MDERCLTKKGLSRCTERRRTQQDKSILLGEQVQLAVLALAEPEVRPVVAVDEVLERHGPAVVEQRELANLGLPAGPQLVGRHVEHPARRDVAEHVIEGHHQVERVAPARLLDAEGLRRESGSIRSGSSGSTRHSATTPCRSVGPARDRSTRSPSCALSSVSDEAV
jgi:hypothetical protein